MRHACLITTLLKFYIQFSSELLPQSYKWPFPKKFRENSACISCLRVPHTVFLLNIYCNIHIILEIAMYTYIFKKWAFTFTIHATYLQLCEGKKINNLSNLTGHTAKDDYVHKHILVDECGENDMESGTETDIHNSDCSQKWVYWLLQNKI
jgi:hypothetical protein